MNLDAAIDRIVERLCAEGADIRPLSTAPWVDEIERKLRLSLPPSYKSLVRRYTFPLLNIGKAELFGNEGDGSDLDLDVALFRDQYMSPWLMQHGLLHIGHPYIGNYDPVCVDLSRSNPVKQAIVQLNHEDILLQRLTVHRETIADNFLDLLEQAHYEE
jgi:hypothetical protein